MKLKVGTALISALEDVVNLCKDNKDSIEGMTNEYRISSELLPPLNCH